MPGPSHDASPPEPTSDPQADKLLAVVYDELRAVAERQLRRERIDHTLQPTALVHEAYLRLAGLDDIRWRDKAHFQMAAAGTIRRVLIDHARRHNRVKRGGGSSRLTLVDAAAPLSAEPIDMIALHDALDRLALLSDRKSRVVELRFFGGMTIAETAAALDVSTTTVEDDWTFARAWLSRELRQDDRP